MGVERIDYATDDEYQQALQWEQEDYRRQWEEDMLREEYEKEMAEKEKED